MIRTLLDKVLDRSAPDPLTYRYGYSPALYARYEPYVPEVTDNSVLGIPAAWRSIDLISSTVGNMPLHAYENDQKLAVQPQIITKPNALETVEETNASIIYSLYMRGNAYLYLGGWDELMRPTMFEVINPDAVTIDTTTGEPLYTIGASDPLTRFEVIHIRYLKLPGSVYGIGPVEACRLGLQNVLALEGYGRNAWTSNGVPSAVIKVDDPTLTPEQADEIKARWVANHSGSSRAPSVLPASMSVEPLSFSPQDAEFLASKVHSITEVANIFGLPPTRLGASNATSTYMNAQQDDLYLMKYTLQSVMIRLEAAYTQMLPEGVKAKFNPDHLLRGSTSDRYANYKLALDAGWMTINEVRELEDLERLDDGDELPNRAPQQLPIDGEDTDE